MTSDEDEPATSVAVTEDTDPDIERLQDGIEHTRAEMSATISAIETKLSPAEVRDKVGVELKHVEERVREVVQEQLSDAKKLVQAELLEAKTLLREEMDAAEDKIKRGLGEARNTVKQDLKDAVSGAKHAVRAATLGKVEDLATNIGDKMSETRDTLIDTVRLNPIPATIMGVGLVWLLMNRSKSSSSRRSVSLESNGAALSDTVGHALGGASSAVSRAAHQATDAAGKAWQQTSDAAGGAAHAVSDTATSLAHSAGDAASHLVDQAGSAASSVADGAKSGVKRVERGFHTQLNENPMALGAAVLAIGAVVGYALPRTDREDSLMGETRDRMLHQAGDAAHDAATSAAHLAEQALASVNKGGDSATNQAS